MIFFSLCLNSYTHDSLTQKVALNDYNYSTDLILEYLIQKEENIILRVLDILKHNEEKKFIFMRDLVHLIMPSPSASVSFQL